MELKLKILKSMRDGYISYDQARKILLFKNKSSLTKLMNAINELYAEDKIIPMTIGTEKGLMLRKG